MSVCETCNGTGWVCAHTDKAADEEHGTCCKPWESEEFGFRPGDGCPSQNGCPDCHRPPVIIKYASVGPSVSAPVMCGRDSAQRCGSPTYCVTEGCQL